MRVNRLAVVSAVAAVMALGGCVVREVPDDRAGGGGGVTCQRPAAGDMFQAGENLGGYWGMHLPASFKGLRTEAQVDRAISRMANTESWVCFEAFYGGAVRKWRENTR